MVSDLFTRTEIRIPSATPSWELDGWRYTPTKTFGSKTSPVVVMAHGFAANKLLGLAPYAEAFASIGYACIVFDYRRWGTSDGTPRNTLVVKEQLEDYGTVIKWCRQQPEFNPNRVVLWGSSFSGGHVISLSAEPSINTIASIAQCPYTGTDVKISYTPALFQTLLYAIFDAVKLALGMQPIYVPAAADIGSVGILVADGAYQGMISLETSSGDCPNEVNASSIFQVPTYKPQTTAKSISCPILLIAPLLDNLCLVEGARFIVGEAPKAELIETPGDHFGVYPGHKEHRVSLDAQIKFLQTHVPV